MGRKKKVKEPEVKVFEYGDLTITCKCGRVQIVNKGIEKGLQIIITTREDSFIPLECDKCGAYMKLHFIEGVAPEPREITADDIAPASEEEAETVLNTETADEGIREEDKQK